MIGVSGYEPKDMNEQFAEAFSFWLAPHEFIPLEQIALGPHPLHGVGRMPAERFYYGGPRGSMDGSGYRFNNRHLLALFNSLAGYPSDLPPLALRAT